MITCLNMSPYKNGISSDLIPAAIILGYRNKNYNKPKIAFGEYTQVYIVTANSTKHRMADTIALIPANKQVGYYFMSLATGKQIHDFKRIEQPINDISDH